MLAEQAVTMKNVDETISKAINDVQKTLPEGIEQNNKAVKAVIDELNKAPENSGYKSISELKKDADDISATVAQNKTAQDGTNKTMLSKIEENASSISTVVANLNDADKAKTYSAILQMSDAIATKISGGDMTSYLQQDHTGFYIKGSLINIDGTTKIGNNVITKDMIQSKAVTAEKMDVSSLSAITATIGTFQTATSGRRVVIKDSVTEVYNAKGTLVMRFGVW